MDFGVQNASNYAKTCKKEAKQSNTKNQQKSSKKQKNNTKNNILKIPLRAGVALDSSKKMGCSKGAILQKWPHDGRKQKHKKHDKNWKKTQKT